MIPDTFEQKTADNLRTLRTWCVVLSVGLMLLLGLAIYAVATGFDAINRTNHTALRLAVVVRQEAAVAHEAKQLTVDLIQERDQTILRECRTQNQHHRATVRQINREVRQVAHHLKPAQRKQLKTSKRLTLLIFDKQTPLENCQQQLRTDTQVKGR